MSIGGISSAGIGFSQQQSISQLQQQIAAMQNSAKAAIEDPKVAERVCSSLEDLDALLGDHEGLKSLLMAVENLQKSLSNIIDIVKEVNPEFMEALLEEMQDPKQKKKGRFQAALMGKLSVEKSLPLVEKKPITSMIIKADVMSMINEILDGGISDFNDLLKLVQLLSLGVGAMPPSIMTRVEDAIMLFIQEQLNAVVDLTDLMELMNQMMMVMDQLGQSSGGEQMQDTVQMVSAIFDDKKDALESESQEEDGFGGLMNDQVSVGDEGGGGEGIPTHKSDIAEAVSASLNQPRRLDMDRLRNLGPHYGLGESRVSRVASTGKGQSSSGSSQKDSQKDSQTKQAFDAAYRQHEEEIKDRMAEGIFDFVNPVIEQQLLNNSLLDMDAMLGG